MAYATIEDVLARTTLTFTDAEKTVIAALLDDAALLIDGYNAKASADAKCAVSCRMVLRVMADDANTVPMGASQGSMAAGGYSQSWTMGAGGGIGELYLGKTDKSLLGGLADRIGSYSPVQELAPPLDPLCLGVGHYD
jgi:hypothetical protein